ncbi:hypothetical protein E1B28_011063 [Marasmius oreades]|uniref:Uncharacterized protein n=1 Tax=Marasmius oreades TaxID=181124 RepID=A0A9P7UPK1_9AGAR|nr:uncharacterized protein E1B28_011063 [Marasmius oreades]KAG7089373.1 hypothetical protein E1B28_011063 [Marasmius oreades]
MAASRSPGLAIATAAGIAISAGAMYAMHKDVKAVEGNASAYKTEDEKRNTAGISDKRLSSSDVQQIVSTNSTRAK